MAYRESYGEPGWLRFLRWLSASFRLAWIGRTELRMYWIGAILVPLIAWGQYSDWPWLTGGEVALYVLVSTVGLFAVITTHEFGHVLAGRRYGIHTPLVTLSPLGGIAHMAAPAPGPKAEAIVAACGPLTHLLWLALLWPLDRLAGFGSDRPWGLNAAVFLDMFWRLNLGLMLFNLAPFFPMDGGRVLRALLASRMHPNRATIWTVRVGYVGAVVLFAWGLFYGSFWGGILLAIGLSNFLACRQEMTAARHVASPYGTEGLLAAWQADPDAWMRGGRPEARERGPGFFARRRARRAAAKESARIADEQALAADVDRILARVSEVGMAGLTDAERKTLLRASKARRKG